MIELKEQKTSYAAHFERRRSAGEPAWLCKLRAEAMGRFSALGFPTTHDEDWKYTNVSPIAGTRFEVGQASSPVLSQTSWPVFARLDSDARLVFVNGHYSRELSSVRGLPAGVNVGSLAETLQSGSETLESHLARHADFSSHAFVALNTALAWFGIKGPQWLFDPAWVIPAFIIMSLWGIGGAMVIYLAALQGVPQHLYEAAELDGASVLSRFRHVTLPMLSPVIFFNVILSIIGSFQAFTQSFIMTQGGPANASLFYVLYLYRNAFQYFKMGYASAMAWLLLVIIMLLTLLVFRSSTLWVYYEGEGRA